MKEVTVLEALMVGPYPYCAVDDVFANMAVRKTLSAEDKGMKKVKLF